VLWCVSDNSNRRTKNKEKSEGCRLSTRGKKRTREPERKLFTEEFELYVVKNVMDFCFEKLLILRSMKPLLLIREKIHFHWWEQCLRRRKILHTVGYTWRKDNVQAV
jgi:hypothetical protein